MAKLAGAESHPKDDASLGAPEAAKLKKFSAANARKREGMLSFTREAGGAKSGGCSTPTEPDSSSCFGIAGAAVLTISV